MTDDEFNHSMRTKWYERRILVLLPTFLLIGIYTLIVYVWAIGGMP